jgi:hypothetical protein
VTVIVPSQAKRMVSPASASVTADRRAASVHSSSVTSAALADSAPNATLTHAQIAIATPLIRLPAELPMLASYQAARPRRAGRR